MLPVLSIYQCFQLLRGKKNKLVLSELALPLRRGVVPGTAHVQASHTVRWGSTTDSDWSLLAIDVVNYSLKYDKC